AISSLKSNPDAVMYVYALPISCILFGAFFVFTNRPAALPKPAADYFDRLNGKLATSFEELQERYKRYRRRKAGLEA
ncbi:MAG: hypothetical protein AAGA76_07675, partial [Pseudomonadota bacterium]